MQAGQVCSGPLRQPPYYSVQTPSHFSLHFPFSQANTCYQTTKMKVASVLSLLIILSLAEGKSPELVPNPFCYSQPIQATAHTQPSPYCLQSLMTSHLISFPSSPSDRLVFTLFLISSFSLTLRISLSLLPFVLFRAQLGILLPDPIAFTRLSRARALIHPPISN